MRYEFQLCKDYMMITLAPETSDALTLTTLKLGVGQYFEHSECVPGQSVIWDARSLASIEITLDEIKQLGNFLVKYREQRGRGKSAFLVKDDLTFGLARMHQMLNYQKIETKFDVFRDLESAEEWLRTT